MRALINHFLKSNSEEVLSKSLKNCHVKGVHSIMLLDGGEGKVIRLYIATTEHDLHKNLLYAGQSGKLSVGLHPHHCDITIVGVSGVLTNFVVEENSGAGGLSFNKHLYKSKIITGELGFELVQKDVMLVPRPINNIYPNNFQHMAASEIHTVYVPATSTAAWVILEGRENPDYVPYCYTNADPNMIDKESLYQPFESIQEIENLIRQYV